MLVKSEVSGLSGDIGIQPITSVPSSRGLGLRVKKDIGIQGMARARHRHGHMAAYLNRPKGLVVGPLPAGEQKTDYLLYIVAGPKDKVHLLGTPNDILQDRNTTLPQHWSPIASNRGQCRHSM